MNIKNKAAYGVSHELVRQVSSTNSSPFFKTGTVSDVMDPHKDVLTEGASLKTPIKVENSALFILDCYKNVSNLIPFRIIALKALAACHYINERQHKDKIISILFKLLEHKKPELQEVAFQSMKKFNAGIQVDKKEIQNYIKPLLNALADHKNMSLTATKVYLTSLNSFPKCLIKC
uniref:Uncharacterized protein n=1 Tax=Glossina palpalis gambiensis TaxID=67801 RepID=A0A1B0BVQ9_9MUSC